MVDTGINCGRKTATAAKDAIAEASILRPEKFAEEELAVTLWFTWTFSFLVDNLEECEMLRDGSTERS